jgi:hypothetical protein
MSIRSKSGISYPNALAKWKAEKAARKRWAISHGKRK